MCRPKGTFSVSTEKNLSYLGLPLLMRAFSRRVKNFVFALAMTLMASIQRMGRIVHSFSFKECPSLPARVRTSVRYSSKSFQNSESYQNHLQPLNELRNQYVALRHGQSLANVAGIIASNPEIACQQYGLSETGREQAQAAGTELVTRFQSQQTAAGIAIVTSDLLRAKETAQLVANAVLEAGIPLYHDDIVMDTRLRERYFGEWDLHSDQHYHDVWKDDATDPSHTVKNVESVWGVTDRATRCVLSWDATLQNHWIVCVAHGDVLQILQTAFSKMDPSQHRSLEHLETATLRPLKLAK